MLITNIFAWFHFSVLSFEDGLKLVKLRGEAMQVLLANNILKFFVTSFFKDVKFLACTYFYLAAADAASSAMVSIIGLDSGKVQLLCDAANEEVDDSNKV